MITVTPKVFPPKKIKCNSDGNELELINSVKLNKENHYLYAYTLSNTKRIGSELPISEVDLKKYISNKIFEPICNTQ